MELAIDLPRNWEVSSIEVDTRSNRITIKPLFLKGQTTSTVAHMTTTGDSGKSVKAMLQVNGNDGFPKVVRIVESDKQQPFDKADAATPVTPPAPKPEVPPPSPPSSVLGGSE